MSIESFSLWYQKTPIILTGGIATNAVGGIESALPISTLTQSITTPLGLNDFLFDFQPLPGSTLIENNVATYPFANQQVAANAVIFEPLRISLRMLAPPRGSGGYNTKLAVFQNLQAKLQQHTAMGGTFTVATPSYIYNDCLLLSLKDVSEGDPKHPQNEYQWDFMQPLLTDQGTQAAQNALIQKLSAQNKVLTNASGAISYSNPAVNVGNPASGAGPSTVANTRNLQASSTRGNSPTGGSTQ